VRWVGHLNGEISMAVSGVSFRKAMVGTSWSGLSLLICTIGLRNRLFFTVWMGVGWLRAVTINKWVWLEHESAQDSTCVKFGV